MFAVSRRLFSTEAVKEVEKMAAETAKQLQKEYASQCSSIMKVRGHHKIAMNTVKSKNGHEMSFDFSYGWPFRYYCKCNTSTEPLTREMVESFEKELQQVGIRPGYGVYFSKGAYQGDAAEVKCLVVDAKALSKMEGEKSARHVRSNKVLFFVIVSLTYLSWTFFSEMNPQRRRLIQRWHRYVLKDNIDPYAPKEEVEEEIPEPQPEEQSIVMEEMEVEPIVDTPAEIVEEIPAKEEEVVEVASSEEGFFSYLYKSFWWLLGYK